MKFVRDPVHGEIAVPDEILPILDHPLIQRLRRVRQLAFAEIVYPGATHTRLLHSLGTLHVVARAKRDPALLAYALIHDAGHGPFSHAFEIAAERWGKRFNHEERLKEIAGEILQVSVFSPKEVLNHPLRPLVDGGVGADRLDYLRRDSYFAGVQVGEVAWDRIMRNAEARNGRLYVAEKVLPNVEHVFVARFILGDAVYFHKTVLIADEMFYRAFGNLLDHFSVQELAEMDDLALTAVLRDYGGEWWRRVEERRLFKLVFAGSEAEAREVYEKLAGERGEEHVVLGVRPRWYKVPEVYVGDGVPVEEISPLIASLKAAEERRHRWFVAADM